MLRDSKNRLIEEIFSDALEQSPEARCAFLDRACGSDTALRAEVNALLAADDSAGVFMSEPICESSWVGVSPHAAVLAVPPGTRIGAYQIVRRIAMGGMGEVYEAIQDQPKRTVALKLMRVAVATDAELRRFQYESELLGRLRHPCIAQIYVAGTHHDGLRVVPFFAMEYLPDALNIVEFARRKSLSVANKLMLVLQVCEAVQYGHQKGVIHRDLKPANVLVSESDPADAALPKVIDFGVAVATDGDIQATQRRQVHELVGTIQYMSPEQLRGDPSEVDTRSDVYSLGVLMYELLSDVKPYDLTGKTLTESVTAIETQGFRRLGDLSPDCAGDLETIVGVAMAVEKSRRYQSPGELAADIMRFLSDQPIAARPAGRIYQFRKFALRNRALVAGTCVSLFSILAGTCVAIWQAVQATDERNRAVASARRAEQTSDFLQSILREADPRTSTTGISLREALDRAMEHFDPSQIKDPRAFAEIEKVIGSIYVRLGKYQEGRHHLTLSLHAYRALAGEVPDMFVANALSDLAWVAGDQNEAGWRASLSLFSEALEIKRRLLGDGDAAVANLMVAVATCRRELGEVEAATRLIEDALDILRKERGEESDDTAFALMTLAGCRMRSNQFHEAEKLLRRALEIRIRAFGNDHIDVAATMNTLSQALSELGRVGESEAIRLQAQEIHDRRIGRGSTVEERKLGID